MPHLYRLNRHRYSSKNEKIDHISCSLHHPSFSLPNPTPMNDYPIYCSPVLLRRETPFRDWLQTWSSLQHRSSWLFHLSNGFSTIESLFQIQKQQKQWSEQKNDLENDDHICTRLRTIECNTSNMINRLIIKSWEIHIPKSALPESLQRLHNNSMMLTKTTL